MTPDLTRTIHLTTDDEEEAFAVLREKRETGETGWDMDEVRHMGNPPATTRKWCVFRITTQ